jgi:hypothetical protein
MSQAQDHTLMMQELSKRDAVPGQQFTITMNNVGWLDTAQKAALGAYSDAMVSVRNVWQELPTAVQDFTEDIDETLAVYRAHHEAHKDDPGYVAANMKLSGVFSPGAAGVSVAGALKGVLLSAGFLGLSIAVNRYEEEAPDIIEDVKDFSSNVLWIILLIAALVLWKRS